MSYQSYFRLATAPEAGRDPETVRYPDCLLEPPPHHHPIPRS